MSFLTTNTRVDAALRVVEDTALYVAAGYGSTTLTSNHNAQVLLGALLVLLRGLVSLGLTGRYSSGLIKALRYINIAVKWVDQVGILATPVQAAAPTAAVPVAAPAAPVASAAPAVPAVAPAPVPVDVVGTPVVVAPTVAPAGVEVPAVALVDPASVATPAAPVA